MSLIFHKCLVLFSILITTALAGIAPWFMLQSFRRQGNNYNISSRIKVKFIFTCLNMFSGGVFLGVCFMHLLPEVKERMDSFMSTLSYGKNFPATEFLIVIGFFLVLITEIIAAKHLSKQHSAEMQSKEDVVDNGSQNPSCSKKGSNIIAECQYGAIGNKFVDDEQVERNCPKSIQANGDTCSFSTEDNIDGDSDPCHQALINGDSEEIAVRSVLLFLALSLHTIFDGLSLGLQTDVSKLYSLFTAVIIHKILIGFTLGLQIFEYTIWSIKRSFMLMFLFACISPIGMTIGILIGRIKGHEATRDVSSAILNSLATGTFLYVTFIEIIGRELAKKISVIPVLFSIAGFGLMTGLVFFE